MALEQRGLYRPNKKNAKFTSSNIFNTAPPPYSSYASYPPPPPPATPATSPAPAKPKSNLRMIVIIGGIIGAAIVGVVLFIVLRKSKPLLAKLPKEILSNIGAAFGTKLMVPTYKGPLITVAHPDGTKQADFYATSNAKVLKTSNGTTLAKWLNNISFGSVYKLFDQTGGSPLLVNSTRLAKVFHADLRMEFEAQCILKRDGLYNVIMGPLMIACNVKPFIIKSVSLEAKTFMNNNRIISINTTKSNDDFGLNGCGMVLGERNNSISIMSRGSTASVGIWSVLASAGSVLGPKINTIISSVSDVGQLRILVNNTFIGPTEMQSWEKPAPTYPPAVPKCAEPDGGDITITLNRDGTFEGELNEILIINGGTTDTNLYLIRDALSGGASTSKRPL